jgi:hypothetical protein
MCSGIKEGLVYKIGTEEEWLENDEKIKAAKESAESSKKMF